MLDTSTIIHTLEENGFRQTDQNTKTLKFESDNVLVYVKAKTQKQPLVVHPDNQIIWEKLKSVAGTHTDLPFQYYHNSTMRSFPQRLNTGQEPTKYGIAFGFDSTRSLLQFLQILLGAVSVSILQDDVLGPQI